jgi:hypothetical protein
LNKRLLTRAVGRPHERDREGKCKESNLHNNLTPQLRSAVRHCKLSSGALRNNPPRSVKSHRTFDEHRHTSEVPLKGINYYENYLNTIIIFSS